MPHTFPRDERARLNNEERRRDQPAEGMIERMDPRPQERCIDLGCGTGYLLDPAGQESDMCHRSRFRGHDAKGPSKKC